jgi:AbrB family looped-hinge helix DNA binding protein
MTEAKLSSKNQIVIPREARETLKLKAGDKLVFPKPKSWEAAIHGIARGLYPEDYIEKERRSWD